MKKRGPPLPRRRWVIGATVIAVLCVSGYLLGRQLWAHHHQRQAEAALDDGDHERALASLTNCYEVWPNDPELHLLAARAERMAGHATEAARRLQSARDAGADAEALTLQQQLLDATTGKLEQVEPALRRHVDAGHPGRRQILDVLIRAYLLRGRAQDAERDATAWIDQSPGDWQPWFL